MVEAFDQKSQLDRGEHKARIWDSSSPMPQASSVNHPSARRSDIRAGGSSSKDEIEPLHLHSSVLLSDQPRGPDTHDEARSRTDQTVSPVHTCEKSRNEITKRIIQAKALQVEKRKLSPLRNKVLSRACSVKISSDLVLSGRQTTVGAAQTLNCCAEHRLRTDRRKQASLHAHDLLIL